MLRMVATWNVVRSTNLTENPFPFHHAYYDMHLSSSVSFFLVFLVILIIFWYLVDAITNDDCCNMVQPKPAGRCGELPQ